MQGEGTTALEYFADDAVYRVNAWNDPLIGVDAIAKDFERQRGLWSDLRIELLNVASAGNVVFTERLDTVHMMGQDITLHMCGVFEVGGDGKIISYRDYLDIKEVEARLAPASET